MTIITDGLITFGSLTAFTVLGLLIRVTFRRGRRLGDP
jgi:hypothetical protein